MHFYWDDKDLILSCHIQPGAKKTEFAGLHGERLKIRLKAPPIDGKANTELITFISRTFGVNKAAVILESGALSRQKRLRIENPQHLPPDSLVQA